MTTAIAVSGLGFTYPGNLTPTLHDMTFDVSHGEVFGFLGPSGAGKSTTQCLLTGLLSGYTGSAMALGREISAWGRGYYERVGVGFETPISFGGLTLAENLAYFAHLYRGPTADPIELLERVGLADDARLAASKMSKGMGVRLNVARALLHRPELIFLDEPTSGLDPVGVRRMMDLIGDERATGHTVIITTHDMSLAERICDRVAFIIEGRIARIGAPEQLRRQHGADTVKVSWAGGEATFPMAGLADNPGFHKALRHTSLRSVHSQEADLADVFTRLTGARLT